MPAGDSDRITRYLHQLREGNRDNEARLIELILPELHAQAVRALRHWGPGHSLQATELVNEAYLRCLDQGRIWENRRHLYGVAATVMRLILVDHSRKRHAGKRGGSLRRAALPDTLAAPHQDLERALLIAELLDKIALFNPRGTQVADMFYFGGLTVQEISAEIDRSEKTVKRDLDAVRAWMRKEIAPQSGEPART